MSHRLNQLTSRCIVGLAALAAVTAASGAQAAVAFTAPTWTRPATMAAAQATLSTYQAWDVFSSPAGPNLPDRLDVNPNGSADAFDVFSVQDPNYDTSVTSTGNLYAGHSPIKMHVVVPNYGLTSAAGTQFHLQIRTRGTELFDDDGNDPHVEDYSRLFIDGQLISALPSFAHTELYRLKNSGTNSYIVEQSIDFVLPGNASSYTIEWTTPERGSCSQDEIALDTAVVVPEPALCGFVLLALPIARRRRLETMR